MTDSASEGQATGRLDDAAEEAEVSHEEGAAAAGKYDAGQGSPGGAHPVGESYPDEAVRYDEPDERPRSETGETTE